LIKVKSISCCSFYWYFCPAGYFREISL